MPDVQETIVNHGGHDKTKRGWGDIVYARLRQAFDRVGQTIWVKSHVLASEKSILIYRNSWKERMAQMTNNKTNSIKPAIKLGDNVKALKMCGLISIYLAWRNLKTGFCHALANSAHPLTACRWFNQLCFELAQLASGTGRQPRHWFKKL